MIKIKMNPHNNNHNFPQETFKNIVDSVPVSMTFKQFDLKTTNVLQLIKKIRNTNTQRK